MLTGNAKAIADIAAKQRLPAVGEAPFANAGGLIGYGPDYPAMFRRAASYVDKILKGTSPAELPVEQPTKFNLIINLKTAKALGLTVRPTLIALADDVIE
jgi:putative ABC transport system substrate-binding protein